MSAENTNQAAQTAAEMVEHVANDTETTDLNEDAKAKLREQLKGDLDKAKDKQIHWSQRERGQFVEQLKAELGDEKAISNLDTVAELLSREIENEVFETEMDEMAQDYEGDDSDMAEANENPARRSIEQTYERLSAELPDKQRGELKDFIKEQLAAAHEKDGLFDKRVTTAEANDINKAIIIKAQELEPTLFNKGGALIDEVANIAGVATAAITEWLGFKEDEEKTAEDAEATAETTPDTSAEALAATVTAAGAPEKVPAAATKTPAERMEEAEVGLQEDYEIPAWANNEKIDPDVKEAFEKAPSSDEEKADVVNRHEAYALLADWGVINAENKDAYKIAALKLVSGKMLSETGAHPNMFAKWGAKGATTEFSNRLKNNMTLLTSSIKERYPDQTAQKKVIDKLISAKKLDTTKPEVLLNYLAFGDVHSDVLALDAYWTAHNETAEAGEKITQNTEVDIKSKVEMSKTSDVGGMETAAQNYVLDLNKSIAEAQNLFNKGEVLAGIAAFFKGLLPFFKNMGSWFDGSKKEMLGGAEGVDATAAALSAVGLDKAAAFVAGSPEEQLNRALNTELTAKYELGEASIAALENTDFTIAQLDTLKDSQKLLAFKKSNNINDPKFDIFVQKKTADGMYDLEKNGGQSVWEFLLDKQKAKTT